MTCCHRSWSNSTRSPTNKPSRHRRPGRCNRRYSRRIRSANRPALLQILEVFCSGRIERDNRSVRKRTRSCDRHCRSHPPPRWSRRGSLSPAPSRRKAEPACPGVRHAQIRNHRRVGPLGVEPPTIISNLSSLPRSRLRGPRALGELRPQPRTVSGRQTPDAEAVCGSTVTLVCSRAADGRSHPV